MGRVASSRTQPYCHLGRGVMYLDTGRLSALIHQIVGGGAGRAGNEMTQNYPHLQHKSPLIFSPKI